MAKPKPNNEEAVSLFPFLSILACLIGVLTFIITGVAISQMDQSEDLAAVERTEKYGPLVTQLEADKVELDELEASQNAQQRLEAQITQIKSQITKAQKQATEQEGREKIRQQAAAIQKQLTQVNQQINKTKPQLSDLRAQVQLDQAELEKRIEAGKPAGTLIRPSGSGLNLKPHFIECNQNHLILHIGGKQVRADKGKLRQSKPFMDLLDRVAKQEKERVVFLLRPEGTGIYYDAVRIARERQCRNGKIPVPAEGPLDLGLFDKKKDQKKPAKTPDKEKDKDKQRGEDEGKDKERTGPKIFDVPSE